MLSRVQLWPAILAALSASAFAQPAAPSAVLTQYCLTCHNPDLKTADLVLNPADLAHIGAKPEQWEKVVAKLRTNAMPPAGMPRPNQATYNSVATYLETELDRAAAAKPNPGKLPLLHRLSRTEYENAIRDLLALDALAQRDGLLAAAAARQFQQRLRQHRGSVVCLAHHHGAVSRCRAKNQPACRGRSHLPVMVNSYRLSPEQTQDTRVDALPFGTRGGLGVRTYFPLDGDYAVKFELVGRGARAAQIEVSVDGERMQLVTVGDAGGGRGGRGGRGRGAGGADKPLEIRIPVKAGSRLIGVAFVERDEARDEAHGSSPHARQRVRSPRC